MSKMKCEPQRVFRVAQYVSDEFLDKKKVDKIERLKGGPLAVRITFEDYSSTTINGKLATSIIHGAT